MTRGTLPERPNQREKRGHHRTESPLQATRRADANQLPHEEPEIEAARVDQQPLQNVRVSAEVDAVHAARLVEMREGPLQAFPRSRRSRRPRAPRMRRLLRYTAARASGCFVQLRRPRSGSEM